MGEELLLPVGFMVILVALMAYAAVRQPSEAEMIASEAEMIERLVRARVDRKLAAMTKAEIDNEVEVAADHIVGTHKR